MGATQGSVRWGIERRLEFVEFWLFWEGRINRSDLMDAFGISINQASTDLNRDLGVAPHNMVYDKRARTYARGDRFKPILLKPDSDRYLSQLRSISDGIVTQEESWIGQLPAFDTVCSPARGIDAGKLRTVLHAILRGMESSGFMASNFQGLSPARTVRQVFQMTREKENNNKDFATTVCYESQQWFTAHRLLAKLRSAGDRKPSLSLWPGLVGELEADNTNALTSRLHPTTAGGRSREHEGAKSTLHKLD